MANEKRLIDADSLISRFCELANRVTATDNWFHLDSIADEIMDAHTVDAVEVVHGRWAKQIEDGMYWYECSECGGEVPKTRYKHDWYSRYCPNCGAKMDGDGNG